MEEVFINKVANSGIETINLETYFPVGERVSIDVKELLFMELVLKEKDFREWIKANDWTQYSEKFVAVYCSSDAIVPTWAYMLISSKLSGIAQKVVFGDLNALESALWENALNTLEVENYKDKKVVIKGCGDLPVSAAAYTNISSKLVPVVQSLMYGEPCSTVPVFKRKTN
jgi:hypothetical protein